MAFKRSHIVFGIVCVVFTVIMLGSTTDEEYFMEVTDGYGYDVLPFVLAFWLGIITVCYIAYLIIDKIRSKRKPNP